MDEHVYIYSNIKTNLKTLVNNRKVGENNKHYILTCPVCEDKLDYHQAKLYVTKDYKVGFCQRCRSKFFHEVEIGSPIEELVTPSFNFTRNEEFSLSRIDCSYAKDSPDLSYDNIQYLSGRYSEDYFKKELEDLSKKYEKRFCGTYSKPKHSLTECNFKGRKNKIIIPFYWDDELIYYQVRNQPPMDATRYFMPIIDHKPVYSSPFNSKNNNIGILCEGVFGAVATSFKYEFKYNTYALQGSYITDYQLWMIESLGLQKLVLYFDDFDISLNIKKKLISRSKLMYENTEIITSKYHDPEIDYLGNYIPEIHDINWIYRRIP